MTICPCTHNRNKQATPFYFPTVCCYCFNALTLFFFRAVIGTVAGSRDMFQCKILHHYNFLFFRNCFISLQLLFFLQTIIYF